MVNDSIDIKKYKFMAEKLQICAQARESMSVIRRAKFNVVRDYLADHLVAQITTHVLAMPKERITVHEEWPRDWWQALRERWFPKWYLRKYPVVYKGVYIDKQIFYGVCPHLDSDPRSDHLSFMAMSALGKFQAVRK